MTQRRTLSLMYSENGSSSCDVCLLRDLAFSSSGDNNVFEENESRLKSSL